MKTTALCHRVRFIIICTFVSIWVMAQPTSWQSRGVGGGGALFYPTINPANDNEFYVACDMSQLLHSTDFGLSYTQVPFTRLQVGNVTTYEFTSNNSIAFSIANNGDINYGVRTLNGGSTWTTFPGEPLSGEDVFALKADAANPGRIVIDYYDALYFSNNSGNSFSLIRNAATGDGITIAGVFFDNNDIYIGTNEGILYSSNGGTSFAFLSTTGMPAGQKIFSFAGAKAGGTTRFFCVTADAGDVYNGIVPWDYWGFAKGVYSMDAGTNVWNAKATGINFSTDFVMYVGMARNDINTVYLGGSDDNTGGNMVMKTSDAGNNWSKVFKTANNQNIRTGWSGQGGDRSWGYGESCFGITVAPNNANKVLFGDFGFVHKTSDGGATWQQAYVSTADEHAANAATPSKRYYHSIGIENTTCWQVYWQDANNMFAAFSDINGVRSTDGGVSWSFDYTGHTINSMYRIAKHATNSTMFAATSGIHDMYQSTRLQDNPLDNLDNGGRIIYSATNGASWQLLHQFDHPVFWVATDPGNPNRMYASVVHSTQGGIWMTNDLQNLSGSTWTKIANHPARTEGHPAAIAVLNDGKMVCTFSGHRTGAGFTASSGVFIYDPLAPPASAWTDVSDPGMQYWTKDIVIDPSDPAQNTWYVCVFSGWGGAPNGKGGLYKTTNRGASWTKLTGTQFDRVTSITFNPLLPSEAYLTTEVQGLWMSSNMNAATPTWSLVTTYPFRQPERVFFNPFNSSELWVSSFGNGMKVAQLSVPLPMQLLSFSGNRQDELTTLQWSTENESPGDHFSIERSKDGVLFETIGHITGKGNNNNQYQFTETVAAPVLYYRIKIIHASDSYTYSHTIVFKNNSTIITGVKLLSNPVATAVHLQATVPVADKLMITLVDLSGNKLLQQQVTVSAGINQFTVPLPPAIGSGVYILRTESAQLKKSLRLLVK